MAEESRSRGFGVWLWLALLSVPVLYALSAGPAAVIANRSERGSEHPLMAAYVPVQWAHENTPLRGPIESYIGFWEGLFPDEP